MLNNGLAVAGVVIKELYRRKDFYVLFILTALITVLLASVNLFNEQNIARFIKETCLLLIWISSLVIAVTTAARQIPAEKENRTIFPLLAKPLTRAQLVFGKFVGCWLASGLVLLVFYLFFAVVSGTREQQWPGATYVQACWMHWIMLAIVIGMVLLGSVVFAAPSSNATISFVVILGILFTGQHLGKVALRLPEPTQSILFGLYYSIPQLGFYDMRVKVIHNIGGTPWLAVAQATMYGIGYTVLFLFLTWIVFRRKSLN